MVSYSREDGASFENLQMLTVTLKILRHRLEFTGNMELQCGNHGRGVARYFYIDAVLYV